MQSLGRPDQLEARLFGQLSERERERVKRFAAGVAGRRLWVPLPLRPRASCANPATLACPQEMPRAKRRDRRFSTRPPPNERARPLNGVELFRGAQDTAHHLIRLPRLWKEARAR